MVEMELIDLLRQLEMIVEEAPAKAFSHKVVVDREEILSLIKEMIIHPNYMSMIIYYLKGF